LIFFKFYITFVSFLVPFFRVCAFVTFINKYYVTVRVAVLLFYAKWFMFPAFYFKCSWPVRAVNALLLSANTNWTTTKMMLMILTKKGQSNLATGGIAAARPANSSFVFARWQHKTDGLAAICNYMFWLGVRPQNLFFSWGSGTPI